MAASDHLHPILFHGSMVPFHEFMRAPAIHVSEDERGTIKELSEMGKLYSSDGFEKAEVHPLVLSKHAVIADTVFSDAVANRAHKNLLRRHGLKPTESVGSSAALEPTLESLEALHHLRRNRIIRYKNDVTRTISLVVPSPHMNLYRAGESDPLQQTALPMDYSMTNPSALTMEQLLRNKR